MEQNAQAGTEKAFVPWMGWLRLLAMLMVCVCHAGDPLMAFGTPEEKVWGEIYGSFVRPCVPLFVMLTGALILPVRETIGGMVKRRVTRVVWPFLIWTAVYAALPWLLHTLGAAQDTVQRVFFPFAAPMHVDAASIPRTFVLSLFQFNQYAVQLWYIYLLVGLYLFMPVLSAWLREASLRSKVAFLGLWGGSLLMWYWPLFLHGVLRTAWGAEYFADYAVRCLGASSVTLARTVSFDQYPVLGTCDWNTFGGLYMFGGFVGYLVLGHVLKTVRLSLGQTLAAAVPLIAAGYAAVLGGTHWVWTYPGGCTAKAAEFFWWYCSVPVAMMSAGMFLLIRRIAWAPRPVLALLKDFAACGFGVFCAHYVLVTGFFCLLRDALPVPVLVPSAAVLGLTATWLAVSGLGRIPGMRRLIG